MACAAGADDAPALLHKHACDACHSNADVGTGPSWADIAAKYRGNPRAAAIVTGVIRKGRHGGGPWPMPPLPQVPDTDAKVIADYVLSVRN
jgi:cytochrome c551/c552